ncbi:hypothetical protein [Hymenobacter lapidiphilus]|uniref:Uncharacterized protein n=1 Tax=Hymenobacter lapidiphilus TaxID=2608003 RepID=A0A7Y7U5M4_9BACT|nr:hypothetical protein [Hymenobacter lapidiphilus]NVO31467.1 hypothetical protein [Hymenobacter lapidiphilus]
MNPIHWLFARSYHYIHILLPDAKVEKLPEATMLFLDSFLFFPFLQVMSLVTDALNIEIGSISTVAIWVAVCYLNRRLLLADETVARILSRYPVKPASKAQAQTFFGTLVLLALLLVLFPVSRMLR